MVQDDRVVEIDSATVDEVVRRAAGGETVVLANDGRPEAAVLAIDALRKLTEERELLRRLALGELESAAGEGDDLDVVLSDCAMLLEDN
jgi:antitoxin (DNA-binding transcriptional repressor) of toxin-antitoxin stability system